MSIFGTTMTGFGIVGSTAKTYSNGMSVYGLMASRSDLMPVAVIAICALSLVIVSLATKKPRNETIRKFFV